MSELDQAPFIEAVRKSRDQATCEAQDAVDSRAKADAQALADMRTLDDWASPPEYRSVTYYSWGAGGHPRVVLRDEGAEPQNDHTFRGATTDEARAAAAKWAREQKGESP